MVAGCFHHDATLIAGEWGYQPNRQKWNGFVLQTSKLPKRLLLQTSAHLLLTNESRADNYQHLASTTILNLMKSVRGYLILSTQCLHISSLFWLNK